MENNVGSTELAWLWNVQMIGMPRYAQTYASKNSVVHKD